MKTAQSSNMRVYSRDHFYPRKKRRAEKQPPQLFGAWEESLNYLLPTLPPLPPPPPTALPPPSAVCFTGWARSLPRSRPKERCPPQLTRKTTGWPPAPSPEAKRDSPLPAPRWAAALGQEGKGENPPAPGWMSGLLVFLTDWAAKNPNGSWKSTWPFPEWRRWIFVTCF